MILVSAFGPFDIDPENSTELTLKEYLLSRPDGVSGIVLPVSFERAWPALLERVAEVRPKAVIALGQAESRAKITIEQVALNWIDARIEDADGRMPMDLKIDDGPDAVRSNLPSRRLLQSLVSSGLPADLSYTAGTYVCNSLMYSLVRWGVVNDVYSGFVHFPLLEGQKLGAGREHLRPPAVLKLNDAVKAVAVLVDEMKRFLAKGKS